MKWGIMFLGEYSHTIDNKGRVAIPAKFRKALKKGGIVTRGLDNCLFLYPYDEWEKLVEKISALPISQASSRAFSRLMLSGAMEVSFDSQGRVVLPDYLRTFAGLEKKAVIAGLYNRLEIWDESVWRAYCEEKEKESSEIASSLEGLGI